MEIHFKEPLFEDDYFQLLEEVETISYKETLSNWTKFYEQVSIDTKDLIMEEFDDWLESWLDAKYKLERDKIEKKYYLTQF